MKLFFTFVLASVLLLKTTEGADIGATCGGVAAATSCPYSNAECDGSDNCNCKTGYTQKTGENVCLGDDGTACTADAECTNTCSSSRKKCGQAVDAVCTNNLDCLSGICCLTETSSAVTQKCADTCGVAAVMSSVLLLVAALVISRML